jgi:hypothetical protein
VKPLLGKGHTLRIDNFYNASPLGTKLKFMKTDCAGTLHLNRKVVPKTVKEKKLRKGEIIAQHSGRVCAEMVQQKICQHDLNTLWRQNEKGENKTGGRKRKRCFSSGLQYDRM